MNQKMKTALRIVSNVLVTMVVVFAFLLNGTQFIGLTPYSVLTGSMQSSYPVGSLLYVQSVKPETLEVGDVITYKMSGGTLCTHRIVELVPDEEDPDTVHFRTKGDENNVTDPLVDYDDVVGKAVFHIPYLGKLASDISQPPGKYIAITAAVALILIEIMITIVLDDKDKKKS